MNRVVKWLAAISASGAVCSSGAWAAIIEFTFTGEVATVSPASADPAMPTSGNFFNIGDSVSVLFTIDTDQTVSDGTNSNTPYVGNFSTTINGMTLVAQNDTVGNNFGVLTEGPSLIPGEASSDLYTSGIIGLGDSISSEASGLRVAGFSPNVSFLDGTFAGGLISAPIDTSDLINLDLSSAFMVLFFLPEGVNTSFRDNITFDINGVSALNLSASEVPLPAAFPFMLTGIAGFAGLRARSRRNKTIGSA